MINELYYLPTLIVAKKLDGSYIHLREIIETNKDDDYFCPCCGAKIKPRALASNKVQPHFYHSEGSECNKENIAHWIYKNWLFDKGCNFIINKDGIQEEFQVKSIEIEKNIETKFGIYNPDIIVTTTTGKIIYFEINYSNKKDVSDYFCRWDELKNDVVEVNIKTLMDADFNKTTPVFNLIYADGNYLKQYIKNNKKDIYANTIAVYKCEISKKDSINYKTRWETLDWFWIVLTKYRLNKIEKDEVLESFKILEQKDKYTCFELIKKLKCIELKEDMYDILFKSILENKNKANNIIASYGMRRNDIKLDIKNKYIYFYGYIEDLNKEYVKTDNKKFTKYELSEINKLIDEYVNTSYRWKVNYIKQQKHKKFISYLKNYSQDIKNSINNIMYKIGDEYELKTLFYSKCYRLTITKVINDFKYIIYSKDLCDYDSFYTEVENGNFEIFIENIFNETIETYSKYKNKTESIINYCLTLCDKSEKSKIFELEPDSSKEMEFSLRFKLNENDCKFAKTKIPNTRYGFQYLNMDSENIYIYKNRSSLETPLKISEYSIEEIKEILINSGDSKLRDYLKELEKAGLRYLEYNIKL